MGAVLAGMVWFAMVLLSFFMHACLYMPTTCNTEALGANDLPTLSQPFVFLVASAHSGNALIPNSDCVQNTQTFVSYRNAGNLYDKMHLADHQLEQSSTGDTTH